MKFLRISSAVVLAFPYNSAQAYSQSPTQSPPSKVDLNVPDLNLKQSSLRVLVNVDVDGEMCVDISHLVLEAPGDANDQVVDEGSDSSEGSNVLSRAVVELDVDDVLLWVGEVDSQVVQVLRELA